MKRIGFLVGLLALGFTQLSAHASLQDIATTVAKQSLAQVQEALINWKVGDRMNYKLTVGGFVEGTMNKAVTEDTGKTLWIEQIMDVLGQKNEVKIEINKEDGTVVKMIVNGEEQEAPTGEIEIISQEFTKVTVPAGTFECVYIKAKTEEVESIELWANPAETVMDGALKQKMNTGMVDITMELLSFEKGA